MSKATATSKETLVGNLENVVTEVEALLKSTAGLADDQIAAVRVRVQDALDAAKTGLSKATETVVDNAKKVGAETDRYAHENPWTSIGIAAGVGALIGFLASRR